MLCCQQQISSSLASLRVATRKLLPVSRVDAWYSLRVLLTIPGPLLAIGLFPRLLGLPDNAHFLLLGAFFTMLVVPEGGYRRRARAMGFGVCLLLCACFAGTLPGNQPLLALVVTVFWTFGAGMLTIFGRDGGKWG